MASCSDTEALDAIVYENADSEEITIITLKGTGAQGTDLNIEKAFIEFGGYAVEPWFQSLSVNRSTKVG